MNVQHAPRQAERGQSLVEMTVGMVILLIIVMGILDLGRVYFTYLTLQDAAGEAALYLAVDPCCTYPPEGEGVAGGCSNPNNAKYRAAYSADQNFADAIWNLGVDGFQAQVDNPQLIGSPISVAVSYPYTPLTPLVSAIVPQIRLTASASNVVTLAALSCS
jgi:Flp pilus assembly protein TadG